MTMEMLYGPARNCCVSAKRGKRTGARSSRRSIRVFPQSNDKLPNFLVDAQLGETAAARRCSAKTYRRIASPGIVPRANPMVEFHQGVHVHQNVDSPDWPRP